MRVMVRRIGRVAARSSELLALAGRHGPLMLLGGVAIGLVLPSLAAATRPFMGVAVFVFTLGAFLKVDRPAFHAALSRPLGLGAILLWVTFGVPFLTAALTHALPPDDDLALGMLLCMLAPPVGSSAAIAAMLGLSAPIALIATVAATLVSPLYVPALAFWVGGIHLSVEPLRMMLALFAIIGGAGVASVVLRRCAGRYVANNPTAMTGIAVVGLIVVAIGAMRGMQAHFLLHPAHVAAFLAIAFAMNAGYQVVGSLLFRGMPRATALTVGLLSGNRNVTLVWAAVGDALPLEAEVYFAMSVFPIFVLPALFRMFVRVDPAPRAARAATTEGSAAGSRAVIPRPGATGPQAGATASFGAAQAGGED